MPIATVDRRVLGALRDARDRLSRYTPEDPVAASLVEVARTLVARSEEGLRKAMDVEDTEEREAIRAADRRRAAFAELGDAFACLYAGLQAGVALATMKGEAGDTLDDLRTYLDETNPSTFRARSFQDRLTTMSVARRWAGEYLPAEAGNGILPEVDAVIQSTEQAHTEAPSEESEAALAFRELEVVRTRARLDYVAAPGGRSSRPWCSRGPTTSSRG